MVKSSNSTATASVYPKVPDSLVNLSPTSTTDENFIIECPKCRALTNVTQGGVGGLITRYIGKISCYQCDNSKCATEFRWCHSCCRSVCSKCYVDQHTNPNGAGLHEASKWEDLMGVKQAVAQLKQMSADNKQKTESSKNYVATYLDGLKEFLLLKIDEVSQLNLTAFDKEAETIAGAYGLSADKIEADKRLPDHLFDYILKDAKNLANLSDNKAELREVSFQQIPYQQLEKIFLSKNSVTSKPIWFDPDKLQNLLINPFLVNPTVSSSPVDVILLNGDNIAVVDSQHGLFINHQKIKLHNPYQQYGRVVKFSNANMLILTVNYGIWGFLMVFWDETKSEYRHFKAKNGSFHFPLPANVNLSIFASAKEIYTVTHKTIYKLESPEKLNFKEIFAMANSDTSGCFSEIGDVQHRGDLTDFFLVNFTWKSIDMLTLDNFNNVLSLRRVNLALLTPDMELPMAPMISKYLVEDFYLLFDTKSTKLHLWNAKTNSCTQVADLRTKVPLVIRLCQKGIYLITTDNRNFSSRCLEFVELKLNQK